MPWASSSTVATSRWFNLYDRRSSPEYATLRHRLENAHASAEAALVEARRRVTLNEGRNAYERGCNFEKSSRRKINAEGIVWSRKRR
jgi:hypothetical protein